jgi:acyl transferase domain-containing protein/acyl carrier protein
MSSSSNPAESLTLSKRVLLALKETRSKLESYERARTEPIAIIGIGCRFPGGADNPDLFWDLLSRGIDAVHEVPADRWDADAYYDPDPGTPGKTCIRSAGFLDHVDLFDAEFFGISPREARSMDPQQRLLLEVAWEAFENAGQNRDELFGRRVGVFVGIGNVDYARLMHDSVPPESIDLYSTTGNVFSAAAGRLSYTLGLHGPSIALDTACSSSLVAIHLACQSLRADESVMALAGGVNLILSPHTMIAMSVVPGGLSPDGRCKTFDAAANGLGRGEGCGLVVLKRLSNAIRDRDNIVALIRGSAINQDGRSAGLTVPNGQAQAALIEEALANARVTPDQVSYIEAHGPGTALGDPIEAGALGTIFGKRQREQPLRVGSVKTNIGHLESAAGVAGLIKTALILQHGEIVPNLHFRTPNPHIPWTQFPITVPTAQSAFPPSVPYRIAGVSAFGVSGTNAHAVLEEPPTSGTSGEEDASSGKYLLTLSAKTEQALDALVSRYQSFFERQPKHSLADICYTASAGRFHFAQRIAVLADSIRGMEERLRTLKAGEPLSGVFRGDSSSPSAPISRPPEIENLRILLEAQPGGSRDLALESLAKVYVAGGIIDWKAVYQGQPRRRVPLPTYPFEHKRHWFEKKESTKGGVAAAALDPIENDLYVELWRPARTESRAASSPDGAWLIFADQKGIGSQVAAKLEASGNRCILIFPSETYEEADDTIRLNPSNEEDFERLFGALSQRGLPPVKGIVHLWGLESDHDPASVQQLKLALKRDCGGMLHLVRAAIKARPESPPKVWVVSQGAVQIEEKETPRVMQSPIWGMTAVLEHEHPELGCARIDLDPAGGISAATHLLAEISRSTHEKRAAYRGDQRFVARLSRLPKLSAAKRTSVVLRPDATYLITGGLGGLGRLMAEWMIGKGAKKIVLVGRSAPKPEAVAHLERLQKSGSEVHVVSADVSDPELLADWRAQIAASAPLRGIFHCAGVIDDGIFLNQTWEKFDRVLRAKVDGAWNLHSLSASMDLDFFVLFSSSSSVFGNPGQANYAAANAFLDALARYRRSRGMPGLSINWGIWSQVGGVAERRLDATINAAGVGTIAPEQGLHALERLLGEAIPQAAVMPIRWQEFLNRTGDWRFVDEFQAAVKTEKVTAFIETLMKAPARERRSLLVNHIRSQVDRVLGMRTAGALQAKQGFFEMGMDSITAVELKNRLQASLGCRLTSTVAFECPTIEALADHLAKENLAALFASDHVEPAAPVPPEVNGAAHRAVEQLSEEEVTRLMDEKLDSIETLLNK